jgi:hypothetical protein
VRIEPGLAGESSARIERCLDIFEDLCIVTASARSGLDVDVQVDAPADLGELIRAGT